MSTAEAATIELPMNAAMHQLLGVRAAKGRRTALIVASVLGALTALFWLLASLGGGVAPITAIILALLFGAIVFAVIWGIGRLFARLGSGRQARETTYLRSSGPIEVESYTVQTSEVDTSQGFATSGQTTYETQTRYRLTVAGHKLDLDATQFGALSQAGVDSGTVDYSKHNILFEVKDATGQSVYRRPGYHPEAA